MSDQKMICLGECRAKKRPEALCFESGKCIACCDNDCRCGFWTPISEARYDNLCESAYLRQRELPQ